ncbi:hypothetical protein [Streptomyces sp. SS]|uniref:hypothetical protein n=1 Tax=Streptomyces sp. SS TaxID=260742 RepID=UPI00030366D2
MSREVPYARSSDRLDRPVPDRPGRKGIPEGHARRRAVRADVQRIEEGSWAREITPVTVPDGTATPANSLQWHDKRFGVESMCVGGGTGMAMVVERLS